MEKRIIIGKTTIMEDGKQVEKDNEFLLKSSAFTQFSYKNTFDRSFLKDIKFLVELNKKGISEDDIEIVDDINNIVLPISYIMIKEADPSQVTDYEDYLRKLDDLYTNFEWVNEVILLAASPISRQLQNS